MAKHFKVIHPGNPNCTHVIKIDGENIGRCSCGREINYGMPDAIDEIRNPISSRKGGYVTASRKLQARAGAV